MDCSILWALSGMSSPSVRSRLSKFVEREQGWDCPHCKFTIEICSSCTYHMKLEYFGRKCRFQTLHLKVDHVEQHHQPYKRHPLGKWYPTTLIQSCPLQGCGSYSQSVHLSMDQKLGRDRTHPHHYHPVP